MLRCWACRVPLRPKIVRRDGIIRGREPARGGPYREVRCPRCLAESKVEENRRGELFASPPKEISALEYLFGWIDPLAPEDFLAIVAWQEEFGEARRRFFEAGGDRRYSRGIARRVLASLWRWRPGRDGRDRGFSPPPRTAAAGEPPRPDADSPPPSEPVPYPFRILGVTPGASDEEIRAAFHRLARKFHPDKQRDPQRLEEATRRWRELVRAYESIRPHRPR